MKDVKPLFERAQITEQMKDKGRKDSQEAKLFTNVFVFPQKSII